MNSRFVRGRRVLICATRGRGKLLTSLLRAVKAAGLEREALEAATPAVLGAARGSGPLIVGPALR